MHPFPVGTKVQTNKGYFEKFGRKVIGVSVEYRDVPPPDKYTIVRWIHQEGNEIPEHIGNKVMMMSKDLEVYQIQ